jgi:hypothetical protein
MKSYGYRTDFCSSGTYYVRLLYKFEENWQNPNSTKVFQSSILAENVSHRNEDETFPWGFRLSEQIQSPFPRNDNKVKNSKKTEYSNYIKVFFINIQFSLY